MIYPPVGLSYEKNRIENLQSKIHDCPVCCGRGGYYYNEHTEGGERWEKCTMCAGTGQIMANVCISWHCTGEKKPPFKNISVSIDKHTEG